MRFIVILLALFTAKLSFAQLDCKGKITGKILDNETNQPLPFATIQILGSDIGAISNKEGAFTLDNICQKEVDFEVRFVGYKSVVHHHDFRSSEDVDNDHTVYLAPEENLLESVVIEGETERGFKTMQLSSLKVESTETTSSVGELASSLTGVSMLSTGTHIVKPMVHGLHSNRVLILNNGVRHGYQSWGIDHAPEIDPSQVDRIKLIKGASTVKYGPEALGGVILFDPETIKFDQDLHGKLTAGYNTNGRAYHGNVKIGQGFRRVGFEVGANYLKQGDLNSPDYVLSNTGREELGFNVRGVFHTHLVDMELQASHFKQELGILLGSVGESFQDFVRALHRTESGQEPLYTAPFSYELFNPRQLVDHSQFVAKSSFFFDEHILKVQYALQINDRKEFDVRRGDLNRIPGIDLRLITHTFDANWSLPFSSNWKRDLGVQLFFQDNDNLPGTGRIPFVPNYTTLNAGVYSINEFEFDDQTFELGFRYDYQYLSSRGIDSFSDRFESLFHFNNFTLSAGYLKKIPKGWVFRTNIASAWRPPNVAELYAFGQHQSVVQYGMLRYSFPEDSDIPDTRTVLSENDKEVKSERGLKWVTAFEFAKPKWQLEVVPYANWINNYIYQRPYSLTRTQAGYFPYFITEQTDAFFSGLDLDFLLNHNQTITSEIQVAYLWAQDLNRSQPLPEMPPLNAQYTINKKHKGWTFDLAASYTFLQWQYPQIIDVQAVVDGEATIDRSENFDFISAPDGYFLLDGSVKYETKSWMWKIGANNILNTSYRSPTDRMRYYANAIGFNLDISLSYKFAALLHQ